MHPAGTFMAGLATVVLVAMSTIDPVFAVLALVLATALGLLMAVGPERLGTWMVLGGAMFAPMNDLRPIGGSTAVGDLLLAGGFLLLVPTMMERHARLPFVYALGAFGLLVSTVVSSLLADNAVGSLLLGARLVFAGILLPLAFVGWRPDRRTLRMLAWAYVAGQVVNTLWALTEGSPRPFGLTTHPNALALGGLMAMALLLYLYHEVEQRHRWLVWGAALVCTYSIWVSGSRGALLSLVVLGLLYPVIERSAASAVTVTGGAVVSLAGLGWLGDSLGNESALGRLINGESNTSVAGSDSIRREELQQAVDAFWTSPVIGTGFHEELLAPHNIFLEVAVAIGVIGLAAWLLMLTPFVTVLVSESPDRRLGYATLAYFAVGMTQPTLWDRNVWLVLCLVLVAAVTTPEAAPEDADPPPEQPGTTPARPLDSPAPHRPTP